jgi:hypothetical protein
MTRGIDVHAPSQPVLVVGVLVALLAIILYFVPGIANADYAFWLMTPGLCSVIARHDAEDLDTTERLNWLR